MEKKYFLALKKIKESDVKVLLKKSYRGIWEELLFTKQKPLKKNY